MRGGEGGTGTGVAGGEAGSPPLTAGPAPGGPATLLSVRNLAKHFGPTPALAGADLTVREREIVGLVGTSGAGKSTLLDIVSGLHRFDAGTIVFRGFPISLRNRRDALRVGLAMVGQEASLMPDLSVYDNIVLPSLGRIGKAAPRDLRERVAALLEAFGPEDGLPLDRMAHRLTVAQARLVALARALVTRAKLYLFDEPFASLGPREVDGLVNTLTRLRMSGRGVIVAARRLEDVLPFADSVTVLAGGRTVLTGNPHSEEDLQGLRRAAGSDRPPSGGRVRSGPPVRRVTVEPRLVVRSLAAAPVVQEASFAAAPGETVAVHGLKGAGATALLEAIAGVRQRTAGAVTLGGKPLSSAAGAARMGVAFAGAEPRPLLRGASARQSLRLRPPSPAGTDPWPLDALWRSLALPADAMDAPLWTQPAGVARRIAIAGALRAGTQAVILVDPTRGLAPAEHAAVHATLRATAARGCTVVLACPDQDEAIAIADRCLVMREGRMVADLSCAALDGETLVLLASPASTLARNTAVLDELIRENGGAAFWALLREDHVVCLNAAVADPDADPGLRPAGTAAFEATRIAVALGRCETGFVVEPDGSRATVLVPIRTRRGRSFGWIGLTLRATERLPPAAAVAFQVETLAATL